MARRTLFVTGAAGFLGRHLVDRLVVSTAWRVLALSRRQWLSLPAPHRVVRGELTDLRPWASALAGVHTVVHLAGAFGDDATALIRDTVQATGCLLEACQQAKVRQVILASSAAVYGGLSRHAPRESELPAPATPYGASKLCAEVFLQMAHRRARLGGWILRLTALYGPGHEAGVVTRFLRALVAHRPIQIYGDGRQRRDLLYVADAVEAILAAVSHPTTACEVVNVASGQALSLHQLRRAIMRHTGWSGSVVYGPPEPHVARHVWADPSAARRRLGWRAVTPLADGLQRTAEWVAGRFDRGGR